MQAPGRKKAFLKNIKKFVIIIIEKVLTFYLDCVIINTVKEREVNEMLIITIQEFDSIPIWLLEHTIYNRIIREFAKFLGYDKAEIFVQKYSHFTLRELSCNSFVDIVSCFKII